MDYMKLWLAGITITVFLMLMLVVHISNVQVKIINEIRTGGNYPPEQMLMVRVLYMTGVLLISILIFPVKIIKSIVKEIKK